MKRIYRRLLGLVLCLVCLLGMLPFSALAVSTIRVYCQAPADWTLCKAYWWGGTAPSNDWPGNAMEVDEEGIWYIDVPTDASGLIFTNGEGQKSADLSLPADENVMFAYENHFWTVYGSVEYQPLYIVAGFGSLCGSEWNPADMKNRMLDEDGDGIYTKTYENVAAGTYELKVTVGSWSESWGDPQTGANFRLNVPESGSTVTICFDSNEKCIFTSLNDSGVTVSGSIRAAGAGEVTLHLDDRTATLFGTHYSFTAVAAGAHTLTVSKPGHGTRRYDLTVGTEDLVQDVVLCLLGDVTGDGERSIVDAACLYAHVRGTKVLTGYPLDCGDFNGDRRVNVADVAAFYAFLCGNQKPEVPQKEVYVVGEDALPYTDEELYAQLFDPNSKIEVDLDMPEAELQKLQDDYEHYRSFGSKSPIYRMGTLTITITTAEGAIRYQIKEVGARMKGNTSRTSFYNEQDGIYNYIHFKLDFQETFDDEDYYGADCKVWESQEARDQRKDRTFAGLEKLEMRWNKCYDATYLRESYAYDVYRSEGVLAPNCNIGVLTWSGKRMGIYTVQEPVDDIFIERNLPEEDWGGDLYKCGWTHEGATFTNTGSIGVEDEDKCAFYVYDLKTNKKKSTHETLLNLINHLNSGTVTKESYAQVVDVDNFLRFAAVSYFMGNPDDLRNNYNNFYIYFRKSTGQVMFIPYDYDRCLGINREYNPTGHSMTLDNPYGEGNQRNPLYIYGVDRGGFYTGEFTQVLQEVAENVLLQPTTFAARYKIAQTLYQDQVNPERKLKNAQGRDFSFDIDHTASASSGDNMSFADYIQAKMAAFRGYMEQSDAYYIRGDFNNWNVDSAYRMSRQGERFTFTLTMGQPFRFKVFKQQDETWLGTECLSDDTTVSWETDHHGNMVLPAGSYRVSYDPAAGCITLERLSLLWNGDG